MLYLTIVGSLIGYTTYGWLLRVAPISRVTTYAYVNPIVAVALGAIVLSEPITPRTVIASVVIVVAVALIITARSRMVHQELARQPAGAAPVAVAAGTTSPNRSAGQPSASTVRATRRASAITVSIGLTPSPVGNSELSAT